MFEVIALTLGGIAGFTVAGAARSLWLAAVAGAVVGMLVTVVSGELEENVGFLMLDAGQSAIAAVLGATVARATRGRRDSSAP